MKYFNEIITDPSRIALFFAKRYGWSANLFDISGSYYGYVWKNKFWVVIDDQKAK